MSQVTIYAISRHGSHAIVKYSFESCAYVVRSDNLNLIMMSSSSMIKMVPPRRLTINYLVVRVNRTLISRFNQSHARRLLSLNKKKCKRRIDASKDSRRLQQRIASPRPKVIRGYPKIIG